MTHPIRDARKWEEMAGDTPLEQIINSYLTTQFVGVDVPANECLSEAKKVIAIVRAYGESADTGAALEALESAAKIMDNKHG